MESIQHNTVETNGIKMHVAEIGEGPPVLFVHGFPELWYSWRHQLLSLSSLGYRCIAPDLRGYGDTEAPESVESYTVFNIVGDLIGLLDALGIEQIFLVAHDWGAIIAWNLCLFRPDKVKALVNTSVPFLPRDPRRKPVDAMRAAYGDTYYICRFQEPGEAEQDFARAGTERIIKRFLTSRSSKPPCIPKEIGFGGSPNNPLTLPSWLSQADVDYYVSKFDKSGFTGAFNYYRNLNRNWELTAPWTGVQVQVPVKFIVGELDALYNNIGAKEYIHNGGFKKDVPYLQELVVMEGVGHFLTQEKSVEISGHIYEFIKKF